MTCDHTELWTVVRRRIEGRLPVLVLALALAAGGCSGDADTPVVAGDLVEMDADNVVYGMTQILTREGVREGTVRADTAFFYRDSSAVQLRGVHMSLYDENGAERAEVTANRGRLDMDSQDMVGRGEVVLRIPGGDRRIETQELHYSSVEERIWSDTTTVMEEQGRVTCGTAFRSDLEFTDVVIERARTTNCPE